MSKTEEVPAPTLAYSPRQLCRAAGISISLLYQMWRDGDGPKYRYAGSRRLILIKDAHEWMKYLPTEQPENIRQRIAKRKRVA
jgi:hypothetical protein